MSTVKYSDVRVMLLALAAAVLAAPPEADHCAAALKLIRIR